MRFRWRIEAAVLVLLVAGALCLFYGEIIFQGRTFLPFGYPAEVMGPAPPWQFSGTLRQNPYRLDAGGSGWQLEPWAKFVGDTYRNRALPLWSTHEFFGIPFVADAQTGTFDIQRLPALLTTHAWGWDVYYLLQAAACLILTYAFGRSVGFGPIAAFLGSFAYTFSGFMFIRGNMHYAEVYHLLPAILWGTELLIQGMLRRGVLIVATGVAMAVFAGFPEATTLVFLYASSYGAFRLVWEAVARRSWRSVVAPFGAVGAAWIVGIGVAGPQLVPLVEYVGLSYNIHPPDRGLGLVALPARAIAYVGIPYIAGLPTASLLEFDLFPVDDYTGAAVVVLAISGLLGLRQLGRARSVAIFAVASALVWGAKLFGVPGINELGRLPVLVQSLIYIFGQPLISFSLALLEAAGVQVLVRGRVTTRGALITVAAFAGYVIIAIALHWATVTTHGREHALRTVGLALVAGGLALVCIGIGRFRPGRGAGLAACLVVVAELAVLAPRGVYSDRYDTLTQPPFVNWLQEQAQFPAQPFRVFSDDGILNPDYAGAFGLDDPRIVDALYPRRVWDFVKTFLSPSVSDRYVGGWGHPELPTELPANKWLNLSNVRYILRPPDLSPSDASLAQTIVQANYPPNEMLHMEHFTIDGQRREVVVERAPGEARFSMHPEPGRPMLGFWVGLDPNWASTAAAEFVASIESGGRREIVFDRTLDGSTPSGLHWVPGEIDLRPYIGKDVSLVLETRSDGPTSTPGWGDLQFLPRPDPSQFKQVYNGEISIWENTQAAPRAFLVGNVTAVASTEEAIKHMQAPGFDPLSSAVVEGVANLPVSTSPGTARITSYSQQYVELSVDARQPSMLVLTDTFYPGWTATVDGAAADILPTDVAFRGVVLPAGTHQVTFHYAPRSFWIGVAIAAAALVLLGFTIWWSGRGSVLDRKP